MFGKKYIMVSVIKEQNTYSITKAQRFNPDNPVIKGNKINVDNPTFTKRLKLFFYMDKSGKQLNFLKGKSINYDKDVIDDFLSKGIIADFAKGLTQKNTKQKIFDLITGALLGGLITFIVSAFVFGGFTI